MKQKRNAVITPSVMSVILLFVIFGTFFLRDVHLYEVYSTDPASDWVEIVLLDGLPLKLYADFEDIVI